jgi:hypothetical protein
VLDQNVERRLLMLVVGGPHPQDEAPMLNVLVQVFRVLATHPAGKECSDARGGSPDERRGE